MSRPPRIEGRLRPREVDGETVWLSEDGAWVVLGRRHLEQRIGQALLESDPDGTIDGLGLTDGSSSATSRRVPMTTRIDLPSPADIAEADARLAARRDEERAAIEEEALGSARRLWIASVASLAGALLLLVITVLVVTLAGGEEDPAPADVVDEGAVAAAADPEVPSAPSARPPDPTEPPGPRTEPRTDWVDPPVDERAPVQDETPTWQAYLNRGWSALRTVPPDADAARASFEQAIAASPRHGDAHFGMGLTLLELQEPLEAQAYLCEARRLDRTLAVPVGRALSEHDLSCDVRLTP